MLCREHQWKLLFLHTIEIDARIHSDALPSITFRPFAAGMKNKVRSILERSFRPKRANVLAGCAEPIPHQRFPKPVVQAGCPRRVKEHRLFRIRAEGRSAGHEIERMRSSLQETKTMRGICEKARHPRIVGNTRMSPFDSPVIAHRQVAGAND